MKQKATLRIDALSRKLYPLPLLFRIVKVKSGEVIIQKKTYIQGRGSYLKKDQETILQAKKRNTLSKSLRCYVPNEIYDELIRLL